MGLPAMGGPGQRRVTVQPRPTDVVDPSQFVARRRGYKAEGFSRHGPPGSAVTGLRGRQMRLRVSY